MAVLEGGKHGGGGGDGEGRADLQLRLVGPERATMGDAVAYEIRVRNAGPDRGKDVAFRFHIPDGAEFVSATGGGERDGSSFVRFPKLDRLAKDDAVFDTVTVRYPEPGRYVARATVEASTSDPDTSNNEDDEPTTVSPPFKADLQVVKTGPGTARVGDEVRFLITTTNLGPDLADWVDVTDHLPEGAEFVRANRQHVVEGRTVRWEMIHEIHAGESVQDTVWVVFPEPGEYVNRAEVDQLTEDPMSDNDRSSTTVTIEGGGGTGGGDGADLEMRMVGRERATIGETISYELRVRNLGPEPALAVRVQHTVPDGGTFVRATGGGTLDGDGVVHFPVLDRLEAGSQRFDTVFVRYDDPGRFLNRASVGSDTSDPDPSNNEDDEPTTVALPFKADLQVVKTGPATARTGDEVRFLITTTNLGPDLADWVDVTDHLPEGAEFVRANRQHVVEGRTVRWEMIHEIHAGESVQDTVWVVFPAPGEYVNRAEVDQLTEDPESGNDHSSVTVIIEGGGGTGGGDGADLEMRMVAPERATVGDTVPYELRVRNLGPEPALAVRVHHTVPDGGTFVRATGGGTLDGDGVVQFPELARLEAGSQVFDTVFVYYDQTGRFINRARADSDTSDPDPSNNEDDEPTTVGEIPVADLQVVKTGDPDTVAVGDTVTYLITTTNLGPDLADWVYVEDILPEGAQFVDANREFTREGRNIRWEMIHIIDPGDSVQDTVRVVYDSTGTYVNTAAVSELTHDPTAQNDTSHATTVVVDDSGRIDLALDHAVLPPQVNVGDTAVFTLAVSNVGSDSTLGPATVTTVLETGLVTFYQATGPQWMFELDGDTLVATYEARLSPGASASFDVRVVAADSGRAVHPAVVSTPRDGNVANDTATAVLTIQDDSLPPDSSSLLLTKRALTNDLEIGDPVTYVLELENRGSVAFTDVTVRDEPAPGFRFRTGTVTLDGRSIEDPVVTPDSMTFAVGRVEPGARRTLTYRMFVGANARVGPATNTARAIDRATEVTSAPASAVVNVRDQGVFTEEAMILGRVWAQIDSVPLGIPGVRVYLQDGTSAITDGEGNYSFIGLRPRLWVVRVDQSTLPPAVDLKPISSRNAGQGSSAFADLVRGEMHRVDFGAYETAEDTLWYVAETEVRNRRRIAQEAEADGRGGMTWPLFNGWMRDSTDARALPGIPSAFGDVLPPGSLNGGNSNLGPRPADPISAGLLGRWADRGAVRDADASTHCWESESEFCLSLDPASLPIARGDSTVVVRVSAEDSAGAVVTLEASRGRWLTADADPVAPGLQVSVRGEAEVELGAPSGPGDGVVRATSMGRELEIVIPWSGDRQRPFLVTGVIEGQLDGRSLETAQLLAGRARDRLQDPLEEWAFESDDGRYQGGLRVAGFATGDVSDETSLTLRFDSEEDPNRRFFDDIRPEDFYGVYGDASFKSYGAQSRGRVFGALERGRSFLMYGDFLTGAGGSDASALGRYSRTLNGFAQHYEGGMGSVALRVDGFASYDRTNQIVDEMPGLGISGPYRLSRGDGLINTEQVEILIRDRNQPSLILRREVLTRFLDYSVEPFTGRLLFKRPVPSLDDQLNPVSVRVSYEVEDGDADRFWIYGVDGSMQALGRLELGGSLVRDENESFGLNLSSGNATLAVTERTFLFAERARSDSVGTTGDASRLELRHGSERVDARAYYVETDSTFSNPSSGFGRGRRELGLRARADLTPGIQLLGEAIRSESLITGGERDGAQVGLRFGQRWSGEVGYRYAEDRAPSLPSDDGAASQDLNSVRARVTAPLPDAARGTVFAEYEQDLEEGDQRRLWVGGDIRLFDRARLYGRHELISSFSGPYGLNPFQEQNNTVFGIAADYREGVQVFSEYRGANAFDGREAQAAMGLRNRWSVAEGLRIDTSLERLSPVGSGGDDALAITGAVAYTASPDWKGSLRGEFRAAGEEDHLLGSVGYAGRLTDDVTLLGHGVLSHVLDGPTYERSRIGLAYRSLVANNWNGLFRYEHKYESRPLGGAAPGGGTPSLDGAAAASSGSDGPMEGLDWSRTAHVVSGHANYRAGDFTFSGQYGAKFVREDLDDEEGENERASLVGARIIYDLGSHFDVGVSGWALRTGSLFPAGGSFGLGEDIESPQNRYAAGAELGWSPAAGLRIAGGYNAFGFLEDDFLPDQPTDHGFYVRVGYKIDQLWGDRPEVDPYPTDVAVSKIGPARTVIDRPSQYWMFPRNEGPNRAISATVEDRIPRGAQVLDASEGAEIVGDTVRWNLGDLDPGDGPPRYVVLSYPDSGQAVNAAVVGARSPDIDPNNAIDQDTTVVVPYELSIEKTGPADALPDDSVRYSIEVVNLGPRDAAEVIVSDSLPLGAVFQRADQGATHTAGVVTWPARSLAVGESATVEVVVTYPLAGRYQNVARVNAPIAPDRDTHGIEIGLGADLEMRLAGRTRALVGDTIVYRVEVYNNGPGTARNARAQMVVPPRGVVVGFDSALASEFGGRVAWDLGEMPPGEWRVLDANVRFDSVGLYPVESRVFSDFDDRREADRSTFHTLVLDWDLDVEIQDSVLSDRTVEYVIRTHNRGSGSAPHVVVEDSVAAGGSVLDASRGGVDHGDVVRWPAIDALAGGATQIDTLRVGYAEDGLVPNTAVASADRYVATDRVESLVGLPADLRIRKFGRLLAVRGDTLQYVLHVHNDGPGGARDAVVVDSVPPGATLVTNPQSGQASEGVLTWTLGSLAPGDEVFLRYGLTYEVPGIYRNLSAVTSPSDPLPDNDESWHAIRIDERDGLAPGAEVSTDSTPTIVSGLVISADGPALTAVGQPNGYWAIAVNRGPEALSNVQLSLSIPVGAAVDGVTGGGLVSGSAVVWQVDDLPVEGQIFGSVDVSYPDAGIKEVVASVAAGGLDAGPPAADTVRTEVVGARPLLSLSGTASALPDEVVTYVVTLDRVGPGPLDGVVVEDSLPEGARFVGASRGGQLQGRVVRWPAVQLSEGVGPVVDTVQVTYGESGPYENRVVTSPRFPGARDSFTTVVGLAADVRIDLLGAEVSLAGDTVLYNVHVYNAGSGVAQNLELTLDPASGSQVVLADGGDIGADGFVTWPQLDTLGPGSEFWTRVEVIHGRPGIYRHRANVTSAFDPDLVDTFAERTTYVLPRRLQVDLAGPGEASARDSLTYVIESTYRGIGDLGPGYVELALPAAATVIPNGDSSAVDGVVRIPVPEGFQAGVTRSDTVRISFPYGGRYDLVGTARGGNLIAADTLAIAVHPLTHPTPTSVHFGFDSANIRPFEAADLIQIAQQLRLLDPRVGIVLVGHADTVGATDYNQRLGQERADSVQAFLARWGVATPRTRTRSRGETQQLSTEGTWESHAKDRRVEFHFCDPADPELLDFWPCSDFDFPEQVSQRTPGLPGQSIRLTRGPPEPPFRSRHPPSLIPGSEANPNPTLLSDRKKRP